jgi:hypothetical protein
VYDEAQVHIRYDGQGGRAGFHPASLAVAAGQVHDTHPVQVHLEMTRGRDHLLTVGRGSPSARGLATNVTKPAAVVVVPGNRVL